MFRRMVKESLALHREVAREWPTLRERYRAAAPTLTSREGWKHLFED
jgi:galactofuranosylgalactofuranosylrhamnosyl-N-acetylglucosaminyl-diphospho-decaprenol beta-1,5/1,6-galactofuranosyltransferase